MIRKKIRKVPKAPRISSGIIPEGGATANQEVLASGEYYPDRTLVPLILQPFVSYKDAVTGKSVDNALPELTNGQWYRLDGSNRSLGLCDATKISMSQTGTDANGDVITVFSVVSAPGSADYGRLTVRENVPAGHNITYIFTAVLSTDGRPIREFFDTRCDTIFEYPDIEFDNNSTAIYDPLHGEQYYSLNPSLTIDYPVTWKWMSYHEMEGGWVELGTTPLDWAVDKVGDGIKINRKKMQDMIMLRCLAEVTVDGTSVYLEKIVSHTRIMPSFEYDVIRVGEFPDDVDAFAPYAEIKTGNETVTDVSEFLIEWLNSSNLVVATGINPTIRLSSLGADGVYYLRVRDRGGFAAITDDGKLLTSADALLLDRSKV